MSAIGDNRQMDSQTAPPGATPFALLGGEPTIKALVERFYDLMDLEPAYAVLRSTHGDSLDNARQRLFWYLCGWLGGPQYYIERFGHPRLRARHLPFRIGVVERDQWLACMREAMDAIAVDPALRDALMPAFEQTADWMRNQPEGPAQADSLAAPVLKRPADR